jgi:periplasmic protein TonB
MPRELFADSLTSQSAPVRSRWTLLGSLVTHLILLIAVVVMPLTAAVDTPVISTVIADFFQPPALPTPPPVRPVRPREVPPPVNPDAAPPEAGTRIATEREVPAAGNPDGLPVPGLPVTVGRAPDGIGARSVTTLVAPPARIQPVPVGGQIREPRRITYIPPTYPVVAQVARVEGIVILEAIIDETGAVRDVRVLRSIPLLDRAAIDAVSRWHYLPTQLNGVAVPVIMTVTVSFKLR